ncbi:RNA polymerase sigma factor [Frateuria hangzhouensis]|uniref:RNA polymerase sigma factor n=1 Tax=Frateuria hangzhouensis TaxID=2995589 RepID=UPI0022608D43|nr:sigma-70 family RNA polymerase sigma factor [Frateuria sp. STR12]MCX7513891.1 sigma-70 family RNA polymerase sigma factor [Frateuria sp. STR12]
MSMDDEAQEAAWIRQVVLRDDHHAFAQLVRRHQSAVRSFLARLTRNDTERVEDLAQETFLRAYRHLSGFQGRGRLLSWLFRIAWQAFITQQRERARRPVLYQVPEPVDPGTDVIGELSLDQLLGALREDERAALLLHYRHDLSHPEVADAMGLPLGTVKSLIRRGRAKLQRLGRLDKATP